MITEKEKNTMIKHIRECKEIEGIFLATPRGSIWVGEINYSRDQKDMRREDNNQSYI